MQSLLKQKKGDFNFVVLFAIIAGAAILILAVYGALKVGDSERFQTDTKTAKQIIILTDPLEAGFASGKFGKISFNQETKINNFCSDVEFGGNRISVSSKSGVGEEWQEAGAGVSVKNKYIFSLNSLGEGGARNFYVFSKAFEFPYKISDFVILISKNYCFVSAPDEFAEEIRGTKIPLFEIVGSSSKCSEESVRVCFSSNSDCDVVVSETDEDSGYVDKNNQRVIYSKNLIYPAIFSSKDVYDCNVKRLFYRGGEIADVFSDKGDLINQNADVCGVGIGSDLNLFGEKLQKSDTSDLFSLQEQAEALERINEREICGLW